MNLETIINEKLSKKQIVAIVAILSLTNEPYLLAGVAALAIAAQAVLDWQKPKEKPPV